MTGGGLSSIEYRPYRREPCEGCTRSTPIAARLWPASRRRAAIAASRRCASRPSGFRCIAGRTAARCWSGRPTTISAWAAIPVVIEAACAAAREMGAGAGRHAQHQRHQPGARCAGGGTGRSARQAGGAAVHLGLRVQPGGALHHPELAARLAGVFRRAEPRLDDRRHQGIAGDLPHLPPQRPGASRGPAARGAGGRAEADRVRVGVLDGCRHCADRRDLRSGRALRRDDLSGRGACGRHVRPVRRRRRGARRRGGTDRRDRGNPGQGVRLPWRLHRRRRLGGGLHPLLRARLHLHHLAAADDRRGGAGQRAARARRCRRGGPRCSSAPRR